jgi:hypothetical protein
MNVNNPISIYVDQLIVETLLNDPTLLKTAQAQSMVASIVEKVKEYVGNHIDPNDKAGSVLDMLAPGLITTTFSVMGLGKIGMLLGLAMSVFHIDAAGILRSIWEKLKGILGTGKQVSSQQVNGIVQSSVDQNSAPDQTLPDNQDVPAPALADDGNVSLAKQLRQAKLLKIAIDQYEASILSGTLYSTAATRGGVKSILSQVLSFLFRAILAAAGLMVAGDVMNNFMGRPNALDNTLKNNKPVDDTSTPFQQTSNFKVNPGFTNTPKNNGDNWIENVPNNSSSIAQMLLSFAKEVYQGLDGKESQIAQLPAFQTLVEDIAWYNHTAEGGPIVFLPKLFTSKKQLADHFINDLKP